MKLIIIEDEPLTAQDLAACIAKADQSAQIIAVLSSVKEAVAYFKDEQDIDLIFSDIQLGDGLSFEIFKSLQLSIPVIFCTAYDEYALNAFKSSGIDYILKPFTVKTIAAALEKYWALKDQFSKNTPSYESIAALITGREKPKPQAILVPYKDKILPIAFDDISLFYLQNEITYLLTFAGQQYFIGKTLEEIEKNIPESFYRVNRQFLVNRKAIKDVAHYFGRKLLINLHIPFGDKITVSKVKANDFLAWLSGS